MTDRLRTQELLRQTEAQWNAAIETLDVGVILATEGEQVIYWNPSARRLHGFSSESEGLGPLSETPITFELWTPDRARLLALDEWPMRRIGRGEKVQSLELRLRRPDQGWEKYVAYSGAMVQTASGEKLIFLSVHDLTERIRAEEALRRSEAEFRNMADHLPQLAWMADSLGAPLWYNQRMVEYAGVSPAELLDSAWTAIQHPDHLERVARQFLRAVEAGEPWEDTFPLRGADGRYRWFLSRANPIRDDEGRIVRWFGTNTDVTAQRAAATERARLLETTQEALIQAESLRTIAERERAEADAANHAKSEFLATMSHELRTPLNAISGHVQLLELGVHGPVTPAQTDALHRVQQAQHHLLRLINDVLNLAKLESGRVEFDVRPTAPVPLIREMATLVEAQARAKGLVLMLDLPREAEANARSAQDWEVWADRDKLAQILLNLLSNATKFTPTEQIDGTAGRITVELASSELDSSASELEIRITDTGIGIPADRLEAVFEPFIQVSAGITRRFEGTGLGLGISRDLARGMGGILTAESELGVGSTFTIVLRRVRERSGEHTDRRVRHERRESEERHAEERRTTPTDNPAAIS